MKKIISISTKTGDRGQTSLANGQRFSKSEKVFSAIGVVDELNSWLGYIASKMDQEFKLHQEYIYVIQETLFHVGAELAKSPKTKLRKKSLDNLEHQTAQMQDLLADDWHTKFLLPGGTEIGAIIDIGRTVCRRAERQVIIYKQNEQISPLIPKYLNRLSDYLYLLRCLINHELSYHEQHFDVQKELK